MGHLSGIVTLLRYPKGNVSERQPRRAQVELEAQKVIESQSVWNWNVPSWSFWWAGSHGWSQVTSPARAAGSSAPSEKRSVEGSMRSEGASRRGGLGRRGEGGERLEGVEAGGKERDEDELGAGGYGFVMTARHRIEGHEVAVKFIIKEKVPAHAWWDDDMLGRVPTEVMIMSLVEHENIVRCLDLFEDNLYFYLVSPQVRAGSSRLN